MAESRDIQMDENWDLKIRDGDFVVGPADQQNMQQILLAEKGSLKEHPTSGAGIRDAINSNNIDSKRNRIETELQRDGYRVNLVRFEDGQLDIDAKKTEATGANRYEELSAILKGLWNTFYIEISDDDGQVDPNQYRRIWLNLGTYYSIDEQYAYPDQDGYETISIDNKLIKVRVDDAMTDYVPGLVRADILFEDQEGQLHELNALPVCFIVHN